MAIGKAFRTWRGGRGGNISVMSALFIPAVLAVGGIAVDFQFTVRQKNKVRFWPARCRVRAVRAKMPWLKMSDATPRR